VSGTCWVAVVAAVAAVAAVVVVVEVSVWAVQPGSVVSQRSDCYQTRTVFSLVG